MIDYLPTCGELAAYLDREANLPDDEKGPGGSLGARSGGAVRISATIPIAARRSARQQRRQLRTDVFAERELDTIPFDLRIRPATGALREADVAGVMGSRETAAPQGESTAGESAHGSD
ncbi:MAG TPA: hypothetical protein VFB81_01305 [Myxococcales bacterium]|nr:hypothetical protein [Myxococcales bacterium]